MNQILGNPGLWIGLAAALGIGYLVWRAGKFLPEPISPAPIIGDGCEYPQDHGERLTLGSVYRVAKKIIIPMPDVGGSLTSTCVELSVGMYVAVQAGFWQPWGWLGFSTGELGISSEWPRWASKALRYNHEAAENVQSYLIRKGVLTTP